MFSPMVRFTRERKGMFEEISNGGGSKSRYVPKCFFLFFVFARVVLRLLADDGFPGYRG